MAKNPNKKTHPFEIMYTSPGILIIPAVALLHTSSSTSLCVCVVTNSFCLTPHSMMIPFSPRKERKKTTKHMALLHMLEHFPTHNFCTMSMCPKGSGKEDTGKANRQMASLLSHASFGPECCLYPQPSPQTTRHQYEVEWKWHMKHFHISSLAHPVLPPGKAHPSNRCKETTPKK